MYINRHPANILSNYIKQNPGKFDQCISELVDCFLRERSLDIPHKDMANLRIIYKFIFMYGLITSNFSTITNLMRHSMAITTVVNALVINGNLKIRQHIDLVHDMLIFGKSNCKVLSNQAVVMHCCICFNADSFYKAIQTIVSKYRNPKI